MKFLCVLCVLFGSVSLAHALDREAFTFTKYDLEVRIEPEQQRLGVRGKIALRNDSSSPQLSLSLQVSSSLNWSSIQFEGKPVEFVSQTYTSDIDHTGALSEAIVVLPRPVAPKQTIEVEIGYEGVIPLDATRLTRIGVPADVAKHSDWDQIGRSFTAVRGIGYVAWYPIAVEAVSLTDGNSLPDAVGKWKRREADAELKATITNSGAGDVSKVLCSGPGTQVLDEHLGAAYIQKTECSFGHLTTNVPFFAIGNFGLLDRPAVNIFYLSEHKSGADDYGSALDEVTPLVTKWFGDHQDKAAAKGEVVDLPDSQAASYQSENVLLMPLTGNDTKGLLAAARQLTDILFPSPRAWIHLGLFSYAQVRLIEEKEGHQATIQYLRAHRGALLESQHQISGGERGAKSNSLIDGNDEFRVQAKAMYVWWMLRDMVGEDALTVTLHNYKAVDDNDPSYMQKLIEARVHRDLQWFFGDWVYHDRGLPDFRIASVYPSKLPGGGYMVTVTIENLGEAGAEVPITLHLQSGEASARLVVSGKSKASVRIQTASLPQEAVVNDGSVPESDTSNNVYKIETLKP